MVRRRRRRSGFARRTPPQLRFALIGLGIVAFVALFIFFIRQSDVLAPEPQEIRVELPDVAVTKDIGADARIRVEMPRAFFNTMVEHGAKVADWREAFTYGQAKATGNTQFAAPPRPPGPAASKPAWRRASTRPAREPYT